MVAEIKQREIIWGQETAQEWRGSCSLSLSLCTRNTHTHSLSPFFKERPLSFDQPADWLDCKSVLEYTAYFQYNIMNSGILCAIRQTTANDIMYYFHYNEQFENE